jgi:hypothetical protein
MGSSGPTAQPSVDRRVRQVQRSIGGIEAIVTDVTTSGQPEAEHDHGEQEVEQAGEVALT